MSIELMSSLSYLHNANVIIKNLTPAKIFVTEDYHIKLADFGETRFFNTAHSLTLYPFYMAPEVATQAKYSSASDIFSSSLIMWSLFERNSLPYSEFTLLITEYNLVSAIFQIHLQELRPSFRRIKNPVLQNIISKMWNANPNRRLDCSTVCVLLHNCNEI